MNTKKITTEEIKRAVKLAMKDYKIPDGTWQESMYWSNKVDAEYKSQKSKQTDKGLEQDPTKGEN